MRLSLAANAAQETAPLSPQLRHSHPAG